MRVDDFKRFLDQVAAVAVIHNTVQYDFRVELHYHGRYRAAVEGGCTYISNLLSKSRAEGSSAIFCIKTLREEFATQVVDLIF